MHAQNKKGSRRSANHEAPTAPQPGLPAGVEGFGLHFLWGSGLSFHLSLSISDSVLVRPWGFTVCSSLALLPACLCQMNLNYPADISSKKKRKFFSFLFAVSFSYDC